MHVVESLTCQRPKEGRISGVHISTRPVEVFVISDIVFSSDILRWGREDFVLIPISIGLKVPLGLQAAFTGSRQIPF